MFLAVASAATARPSKTLCKKGGKGDAVCRVAGEVTAVAAENPLGLAPVLVRRAGLPIAPRTRVRVSPGGSGLIRYKRDATCSLGAPDQLTDVFTRWAADAAGAPLMWQGGGRSYCTFFRGTRSQLGVYCEASYRCPVDITLDGRAKEVEDFSEPVAHVAQDGSTVTTERVRFDFCAGSFEISVVDPGSGLASASGQAGARSRTRATITRRTETVVTPSGTSSSRSLALDVDTVGTRGLCDPTEFRRHVAGR